MITPEMKDQLLLKLIESENPVLIEAKFTKENGKYTDMIINQFINLGLVSVVERFGYGMVRVRVEAEAHDLIRRGGFKFIEEVFLSNVTKLELEIKKLEKDIPADKFDIITKAIGAISAGFTVYTGITT